MGELYNRDIDDLVKYLKDVEAEMLASQSSRLHRGFIAEEQRRYVELLTAVVARIQSMGTGDFPEVHPVPLGQ